jgi:hypothetical protein
MAVRATSWASARWTTDVCRLGQGFVFINRIRLDLFDMNNRMYGSYLHSCGVAGCPPACRCGCLLAGQSGADASALTREASACHREASACHT